MGTFRPHMSYRTVLERLNLLTNLRVCLDAGDSASYSSGQTWLDLSGSGQDFYRGATSSSEASDPTFYGTPGGLSVNEYFLCDGADWFTYDSPNEAWMTKMHDAMCKFTIVAWVYLGIQNQNMIFGTLGSGGWPSNGAYLEVTNEAPNRLHFCASNQWQPNHYYSQNSQLTFGGWNFLAISMSERDPVQQILQTNGTQTSSSQLYQQWSGDAANSRFQIGARGSGQYPLTNNSRVGAFMAWDTYLSAEQLNAIYNADTLPVAVGNMMLAF